MFPSPQQRIHGLNAGLVPGSSPKDNFVDDGLNVALWIDLVLEELGNVSEFNVFYACDRAWKNKYSLNEIFIKDKFAFSIYLWLLEQGLRNAVDYQDEGLLT